MAQQPVDSRWSSPEGTKLAAEIVGRLTRGRPLDDLRLSTHDGRLDLRGLPVAQPKVTGRFQYRTLEVEKLDKVLDLRNVRLENLDLSGAVLDSVGISGCEIVNCRLDAARCSNLRIWEATVEDTSFAGADLRDAFLGHWRNRREPVYRRAKFNGADFRGASVSAATFIDCDFSDARLVKIDFQSSSFIRCSFAGKLQEVIFWDYGYQTGKPNPNPMEDVDFSQAKLRWVEFRRLNLDRVRLPEDVEHVQVHHYRCVIERALRVLDMDDREMARGLLGVVEHRLKWIGPHQEVGIFNRRDLGEHGKAEEEFAVGLLRRLEGECAATE